MHSLEIEKLFQEYKDVCDFVTVYISEAHPKEGWTLGHSQNAELGAKWDVSQPKSTEQRMEVAREWVAHLRELGVTHPYHVDTITNQARFDFAALPERLYVVEGGVVQFRGSKGPWGYHPEEVQAWLQTRFPGIKPVISTEADATALPPDPRDHVADAAAAAK